MPVPEYRTPRRRSLRAEALRISSGVGCASPQLPRSRGSSKDASLMGGSGDAFSSWTARLGVKGSGGSELFRTCLGRGPALVPLRFLLELGGAQLGRGGGKDTLFELAFIADDKGGPRGVASKKWCRH